jgi:hypothetical protein
MEWFIERVRQLDVAVRPPDPILKGRDLVALGVPPGPEVGRVLRAVYERQLDGAVTTPEEARAEARRILESDAPPESPPALRAGGLGLAKADGFETDRGSETDFGSETD